MKYQEYLSQLKKIQNLFLEFIENDDTNTNDFGTFIMDQFDSLNFLENRYILKTVLYALANISRNHHRTQNFFDKISQILDYISERIKQTFSNSDLFNIFRKDLRILLLLIKKQMIIVDQDIADLMLLERHFDRYRFYFYPEIKPFLTEQMRISIEKELTDSDPDIFNNFEEKREIGENDSYLCRIIRNDSIDEFVIYVNQTNLSICTENIKPSIFETNFFLLKRIFIISLTDYAVFFGAIQIINFLRLNNVRMSSSLWLYAIHSNNAELIHLIEGENVRKMVDLKYLKEAIKCHHNDIANYIQTNCLEDEKINFYDNPISYGFHFHNFEYLPDEITSENVIFYACKYDYLEIVKLLLKDQNFDYNVTIEIPDKIS